MICSGIASSNGMEVQKASTSNSVCLYRQLSFKQRDGPYEAVYGRPYHIPPCWTKVGERHELELLMVQETVEKMDMLKDWL